MKLYLIKRNGSTDYDQYDSAVVVAESAEDAKIIHPDGRNKVKNQTECYDTWCGLNEISVILLGNAHPSLVRGVVCASFNAG